MKKIIIALTLAASATAVWANCTSHTIMSGGRMVICTTCCVGSNCTTTCF